MSDDDADQFDYPPSWAPKGVEPPRRQSYKPPLRSGLGVTGDEQPDDGVEYPQAWKRDHCRASKSTEDPLQAGA